MAKRARKVRQSLPEHFIFEITDFAPKYTFGVNHFRYRDEPWWEHIEVEVATACIFPPKVAGRPALFKLVGQRDVWTPFEWQQDKNWRPLCVGVLELPPSGGRFYASIPNDSMTPLSAALAQGLFRYALLYGPPLSRGKSPCQSIDFKQSVDLEDY